MIIPKTVEDITPQWLTQALRTSGIIEHETVTDVESKLQLDDDGRHRGNLSTSYHLNVQYDSDDMTLPHAFFVKLSSHPDPLGRLNVYQKEVSFYQNFAQKSGVRTLKCYYSDIDRETGYHILLLEDMSDALCGSFMDGYSIPEAERAIVAIAKFHGMWWDSPRLQEFAWDGDPSEISYAKDFQADWQTISQKIQCPVPDALQEISSNIGAFIEIMYYRHGNLSQTLVHFDYHVENVMFPMDGSPMVTIDWQSLECGRGAYDVVYNCLSSLSNKERRQHEMRLLRLYHDTLIENGVTDYSFDECYQDFIIGFFRFVHVFIIVFLYDLFDTDAERMRYRDIVLPRMESFITDHPITSILDKHRDLLAVV